MDEQVELVEHVRPSPQELEEARSKLTKHLPTNGIGLEATQAHIQQDLVPGFNRPARSPNFYGFVTGGATPAAAMADKIVTDNDQNVQVHLTKDTIATEVEDSTLSMVCQLLELAPGDWTHRTFTTGATASNVLGLACGREFVIREAARSDDQDISVGEHGLHEAMHLAGIERIQVLVTVPHSSLLKAASIVGLGRACVRDVGLSGKPHRFDLEALKAALMEPKVASIVAVSCAEVNTGLFATDRAEIEQIRSLCDRYRAWIHVDAAFGLLARALPASSEYQKIKAGVDGLELADSITGDAHKLLNVPYDCGIFLSRHLTTGTNTFQNPNAVYISSNDNSIPSPLNIGIENSRRFRALPVYANFVAYGLNGYKEMLERQIRLARGIFRYVSNSTKYEVLPEGMAEDSVYIIVIFRAKEDDLNRSLVEKINGTRKIYVSGTQWGGRPAARFAVANWMVNVERDLALVTQILESIAP